MTDAFGTNLGSAHGEVVIDVDSAVNNLGRLQTAANQSSKNLSQSFAQSGMASKALLGIGAATVGAGFLAFKTAANFEQAISNVAAVANATDAEMDQIRAKALQIGKDTAFSATEGALAIEELVKAGVSIEDALAGGADGATELAAAAGVSLPAAATLISTALNQFGLAGDQATHVADLFAGAANASAADAQGLGDAMSYVGTTADSLGISIEDVTTALAIMADAGIEGSRAGTSLNSALGNMATPTTEGAKELKRLAIDVYDATGAMKPFPELIDELNTKTEHLNDEDKFAVLSKIFDEQGIRAILPLLKSQTDAADTAGKAWTDYYASVDDTGAAGRAAAARLDNFNGSMEQLKGTIETVAIVIGTALIPAARAVVDAVTGMLNVFLELDSGIQTAIAATVGITGAVAGLAGGAAFAYPHIVQLAGSFRQLRTAMMGMLTAHPIILAIVAALAILAIAYKTNFGGFADFIDGIAASIGEFVENFMLFYRTLRTSHGIIESIFGALGVSLGKAFDPKLGKRFDRFVKAFKAIGKEASRFGRGFKVIGNELKTISSIIKSGGIGAGIDALFGTQGERILRAFGTTLSSLPRTIGTALTSIKTGFEPLDRIFHDSGMALRGFGNAISEVFKGNWGKALSDMGGVFGDLGSLAINLGDILITGALKLGGGLLNIGGNLWEWVKGKLFGTHLAGSDAAVATGHGIAVSNDFNAIELGTIVISGALKLGGQIAALAGGVWDWIKRKITGEHITGGQRTLGGYKLTTSANGSALDVGTIIVTAAFKFASTAGASIGDVLGGVGSGVSSLSSAFLDMLDDIDLGSIFGDWFHTNESVGAAIHDGIVSLLTAATSIRFSAEDVSSLVNGIVTAIAAGFTAIAGLDALFITGIAGFWKGLIFGEGDIDFSKAAESLVSLLAGAVVQALTIGQGLALSASDLAGVAGNLWNALSDALLGGATLEGSDVAIATGHGIASGGAFSGLRDSLVAALGGVFEFDADTLTGFAGGITSWFAGQVEELKIGVKNAIPNWMQKLASGDVLGAARDLFGGESGGGEGETKVDPNDPSVEIGKPYPQIEDIADPFAKFGAKDGALANAGLAAGKTAGTIKSSLTPALNGLARQVATNKDGTTKYVAGLQTVATTALPAFAQAGVQGGNTFALGMTAGMQRTVAAVQQAIAMIRALMASTGNQFSTGFAIGVSLGQGIAAGINATIGLVAATSARLVRTAIDAARREGQMHSPSKAARNQVGSPFGEGVALGVLDWMKPVGSAAQSLINAGLGAAGGVSLSGAAIGSIPSGSGGSGGGSTIINVYALDAGSLGRILAGADAGRYSADVLANLPGALR